MLFLLSIGIGVGALVGKVPGPGGQLVPYDQFVAPGLLAAAAMNGAVLDTTFNFFFKFKYAHTYDAMLATPLGAGDVALGELAWALLRGAIYSAAFLLDDGGPRARRRRGGRCSRCPRAVLIGFGFAGAGLAATTFMRSFVDFDYVNLALIPLFLFSATFFPLSQYPTGLQWIVRCTPLYQGVVLERGARPRRARLDDAPQRRLPRHHGHRRPPRRHPPPRPAPPAVARTHTAGSERSSRLVRPPLSGPRPGGAPRRR